MTPRTDSAACSACHAPERVCVCAPDADPALLGLPASGAAGCDRGADSSGVDAQGSGQRGDCGASGGRHNAVPELPQASGADLGALGKLEQGPALGVKDGLDELLEGCGHEDRLVAESFLGIQIKPLASVAESSYKYPNNKQPDPSPTSHGGRRVGRTNPSRSQHMHATALLTYSPAQGDTTPEIVALRAAYRRLAIMDAERLDYRDPRWVEASAAIDAGWRAIRASVRPKEACPIAAAAIAARDVEACRALDLTRCTPQQVRASGDIATGCPNGFRTYVADDSISVVGVVRSCDDPEILGVAVDDVASFAWLFGLPVTHQRAAELVEQGERAPGETRAMDDEALDALVTQAERNRGDY